MVTIGAIFNKMRSGSANPPIQVDLPPSHVDVPLPQNVEKDQHYFEVRVNQLFLTRNREWWTTQIPMVVVESQFLYDKAKISVPFVIGPSMLESLKSDIPAGMLFTDTRVAGLHPYVGDSLALTLILYQVPKENYVEKLLGIVESVTGALDFSTAVAPYTNMAAAVLRGVDAIVGIGDTKGIIGQRREFHPQGSKLSTGYFALIDSKPGAVSADHLWVKNGRLAYGDAMDSAVDFRSANYVLYSLVGHSERPDERALPFYPLVERVLTEAGTPIEENWKSAKVTLASLSQSMNVSPDLVRPHSLKLIDQYRKLARQTYDAAVATAGLGMVGNAENPIDSIRSLSLEIMND